MTTTAVYRYYAVLIPDIYYVKIHTRVRASRLLLPPYEFHRDSLNAKRESDFYFKHAFSPFIFTFSRFHERLNSPVTQKHSKESNSFHDSKLTADASARA